MAITKRPWGEWEVLFLGSGFKIKRMLVDPGKRLSLQKHEHRDEHWHILAGCARVQKGNKTYTLSTGNQINIPKLVEHRIENISKEPLHVLEVQSGDYLEEDDIIRLEDDFTHLRHLYP